MSTVPTLTEIQRILLTEISGMFPDVPDITATTPFQTLGLDSLRLFEIFVIVEKHFGESLVDGPLTRETLENISALATHISFRLANRS
jgi:acyl carrier protein